MLQNKRLIQIASLGGVLFLLGGLFLLRGELFTTHAAVIDPAVYAALEASPDGQATYILYFRQQADLSEAENIRDWSERGLFVYERLQETATRSQLTVQAKHSLEMIPGRVSEFQPFWIANVVVVRGDREALEYLAKQPQVAQILPEMKYDPPELPDVSAQASGPDAVAAVAWGVEEIHADDVWAAPYNSQGEGSVIGVIDTGVQWDHPALKEHYRGWDADTEQVDHNYNWFNPEPENTCDDTVTGTCDWHGHGTHTTGTTSGDDGDTNQIGVAPAAKWIHALGCCPSNEAGLRTFQWMLAPTDLQGQNPDPTQRPHVINNSWGGPGGSLIFQDIMAALKAAGTMIVFSAGNNGSACGTLGSPGDNPASFNVGATGYSDQIMNFSSRGPNPFSDNAGPEVTAPGYQIRSSYPGSTYGRSSGTSMAAPHVTGAIALLLSVEPDLVGQVDQIEELLRGTALPLTTGQDCGDTSGSEIPNNTYGWGRIDVEAAANMIWQAGALSGRIVDAETGKPIAGVTIAATRDGYTLSTQTDDNGRYGILLGAGRYGVSIDAFGYSQPSSALVSIKQGKNTGLNAELSQLPKGQLRGQVLLPAPAPDSYAPVEGATVQILDAPTRLLSITDANGDYVIEQVPLGDYNVQMTEPGFEDMVQSTTVTATTELDFTANPVIDYIVGDGGDSCSAPFEWIDTTDGVAHNLGDDTWTSVALPVPFIYYGNSYDTLYISSNGFVSFGQGYPKWSGVIPFIGPPNNAIYGLGEDLNPASGQQGVIYSKTLDDERFVIEYHQVEHWSSGNPETFEIILDARDDTILIQYQQVSWPEFANVGLENSDGSRGVSYSYGNDPPLTPGLAVKYTPFLGPAPKCEPTMTNSWLPLMLR